MKIGILGCGYVGSAAAEFLRKEGHQISVTTRNASRTDELKSFADHVFILPESFQEFILQQEALIIAVAADSSHDYQSTYLGTAEKVIQCLPHAKQLRQIIYTGSTSVYGDHQGNWVNETTFTEPQNENGRILLETEKLLLNQSTNTRHVCIFRLGEIYGPGRKIEDRLKNSQHKIFPGNGSQLTNLIELHDIVKAIRMALSLNLNGIYNLCNDHHISRKALYEQLCQKFGLASVQWDESQISPHGGNKKVSNQKMKDLGFSFANWP